MFLHRTVVRLLVQTRLTYATILLGSVKCEVTCKQWGLLLKVKPEAQNTSMAPWLTELSLRLTAREPRVEFLPRLHKHIGFSEWCLTACLNKRLMCTSLPERRTGSSSWGRETMHTILLHDYLKWLKKRERTCNNLATTTSANKTSKWLYVPENSYLSCMCY